MPKTGYLDYVNSFRGFAILNIVAIHALVIAQFLAAGGPIDRMSTLFVVSETLFHDSTIYFALISGLLFSHVLRSRGYGRFFKSKLLHVVLPYVVWTLVFTALVINVSDTGLLASRSSAEDYLGAVVPNLLWGEAQFTYWYIPVLLIIFAVTPVLDALSRAGSFFDVHHV